jgi:uncharacterized protein YgfB (UPF0149 family)
MQPDYNLMRQLLAEAAPDISPSSLHGAVTGYLSSGSEPDSEIFADLFENTLPDVVLRLLERLGTDVRDELQQGDYSFQPLLPEDDSSLIERLSALGQWCDWFNIGFAAGYMQPQTPLGVDVMEILNDFGQLAEVEVPDADSEDNENYFMELVEYVRMAALAVFEQMHDDTQDDSGEDKQRATPDSDQELTDPDDDPDNDRLLH